MITIISGTNRLNSNSMQVAKYYQNLLGKRKINSQIIDLSQLPQDFVFTALYGEPQKHKEFYNFVELINKSDKFIFIVPEYNGSFPGILKAFIDGLDYPSSFQDKKSALVGISTGSNSMAGALALSHLTDILNYLGMHVLAIKPRITKVGSVLKKGVIEDQFIAGLLEKQADAIINF